jgi:hypothetical protein
LNLQGCGDKRGKTLQSQTSQKLENRLPISRLGVLHERRRIHQVDMQTGVAGYVDN